MAVESFKAFDEILVPDSRSRLWVVDVESRASRPMTLADVHADLESLTLNDSVPDEVRNHFLTARHLALYSWFVYRFSMPAQLQAYASLEYALRERFEMLGIEAPRGLRGKLEFAASRGFFRNELFRDWPGHAEEAADADRTWLDTWINRVPEAVGYLRNDLAHGSFTLYPETFAIRFVADAINQLFPA